ncbi:MAG: alpha-hydroxy-acid oxidizing protein, partial [Legionellales bacterium]
VLLGRPVLWALAVDGEKGLLHMLTLLINEFEMAMQLTGCATIQDIKHFAKHLIHLDPPYEKKIL